MASRLVSAFITAVPMMLSAQDVTGHWNGNARLWNRDVKVEVEIARTGESWTGDLTVPQFGVRDLRFSQVVVNGSKVELTLAPPWSLTFAGTVSAGGDTLTGMTRGRDSNPFNVVRGPDLSAEREKKLGLPALTPISSRAIATLKIDGSADFLAGDEEAAWVTNEDQVQKLVPDRAAAVITAQVPGACGGMVVAFGSVWAISCKERALYRIDRPTGRLVAVVKTGIATIGVGVPGNGGDIAAGAGRVFVRAGFVLLSAIDPASNKVVERLGRSRAAVVCGSAETACGSPRTTSRPCGYSARVDGDVRWRARLTSRRRTISGLRVLVGREGKRFCPPARPK